MSIESDTKNKMEEALDHLKKELTGLRSGRANPSMVEGVQVEVYGSQMKIRELATVTTPESRQLLISPFDPQTAGPISKGIQKANLGLNPILENNVIRIQIPPLDEAMRKQIVKQAKEYGEGAKIAIRNSRRDSNTRIKEEKNTGELTEDQVKGEEKKVQKLTDDFCKQVDDLCNSKEKEILTV